MIPKTENEWGFAIALLVIAAVLGFYLFMLLRTLFRNVRSEASKPEGYQSKVVSEPYLDIKGQILYRDSEDNTPMEEDEEPEPMHPSMGLTGIRALYDRAPTPEQIKEALERFQQGTVLSMPVGADIEPVAGTLKTWPDYFQLQWDGEKSFEIRRNDRGFKEGQLYYLAEYRPDWTNPCPSEGQPFCSDSGQFTGRKLLIRTKYVMHGPSFGLAKGWVAFGYSIVMRIAEEYKEGDFEPIL
jgi:hypothetical protein